jgi:hypothetical protein
MKTEWNWALTPVLWPLRLVLATFGIELKRPTSRAQALFNEYSGDRDESASAAVATGRFSSQRKAKEYLIGRIVAEAEREGVPLSEVERKMLHFSETDWTLPDILDVNAEFERDYDETEYEEKIAGLVRNLDSRATPEQREMFDDALLKLSDGDHYLQILIGAGSRQAPSTWTPRWLAPWLATLNDEPSRTAGDYVRLYVVAGAIVLALLGVAAILRLLN